MATPADIAAAFRLLQSGDAHGALAAAQLLLAAQPGLGRAHLVAGMALRALGRLPEAAPALERAAALDPRDFAAAYELGLLRSAMNAPDAALAEYERALALRPGFAPAAYAAGMERLRRKEWPEALARFEATLAVDARIADAQLGRAHALLALGRFEDADAQYRGTIEAAPNHPAALRAHGQFLVSRGRFEEAARRFAACAHLSPGDEDVPMFLAQALLVIGRWREGWQAYAHRETRRSHARLRVQQGVPYTVPTMEAIRRGSLRLVAEQGLGDILFFLRFAVPLRDAGVRLAFSGDARLHPMLKRTGLFTEFDSDPATRPKAGKVEILTADLPLVVDAECPPALPLMADPERVTRWTSELETLGPRPWVGVTWRAGTPRDILAHGLEKTVPMETFFGAVRELGGTVVAIQRRPAAEELAAAAQALHAPVHDLSRMNEDLEDALALLAVLDRHVGVSNTNVHLAAGLGRGADVVVPFPPEFRWGAEGSSSPWFAGFTVHRQEPGGNWGEALSGLA